MPFTSKAATEKRFGWYRTYEDFCGHPKWTVVVRRCATEGVNVAAVEAVVQRLFQAASKARALGHIGGFDLEVCAAGAGIPIEHAAAIYRALNDIGFVSAGMIVDWDALNPRDHTATDRQRNKRAKDEARRAMATGTATPEQEELLTMAERESLRRLAAASRVTAEPSTATPVNEATPPFQPLDDPAQNDTAARRWLMGDPAAVGTAMYGPASKIVADNFGCNRLNADTTIRRWLRDHMDNDAAILAGIISAAEEFSLNGDGFRAAVEQRIAEYQRERMNGPVLPLRMGTIGGGRT